jgi:hypothetical protein
VRLHSRLQRLGGRNDGCPACRDRRGRIVIVTSRRLLDGTTVPHGEWPTPCEQCGELPEQIIEIVEAVAEPQKDVAHLAAESGTGLVCDASGHVEGTLMGNVRRRLARLERLRPPPSAPHQYVAFVDERGSILDDRSEAVRPWVGRHYRELPQPVSVIGRVDPLVVLGYKQLDWECQL